MLEIIQLPVLNDNYIYLLHEPISGETAVVDPAVAGPVLETLDQRGWQLSYIFNTHHHGDHVGGNLELKQKTGCKIVAAWADRHRIPGIDRAVAAGETVMLGQVGFTVMATPGHTSGHIVYYAAKEQALFCGDTLFVMGCGRLFEGTAAQMWQSLQALRALPPETRLYCAHEYTLTNGRFALSLEPNNAALQKKMTLVQQLRAENRPTVPSTIAEEQATNPFFRSDVPAFKTALNNMDQSALAVFTEVRKRKDVF
jgi:hydroxyacylglutathione hydrolase